MYCKALICFKMDWLALKKTSQQKVLQTFKSIFKFILSHILKTRIFLSLLFRYKTIIKFFKRQSIQVHENGY
jgi:hypothetical protein